MAMVTARIEDRDLGSTAAELRAKLQNIKLPVGYLLEVGASTRRSGTAFRELALALGIAAALVLLLLVAQFRRFTPALVIWPRLPSPSPEPSSCCWPRAPSSTSPRPWG
jgi:Cu/Ag efflux pump CusA